MHSGSTAIQAVGGGAAVAPPRAESLVTVLNQALMSQDEAQLEVARHEVQRVQTAFADLSAKATPEARDQQLARENERLRARLQDARERTAQLAERVRFLRQQVGQGAER